MVYVLDTHPLTWFIEQDRRLSVTAQSVMQNLQAQFVIPTMVLVEIRHLEMKGRIPTNLAAVYQKFIHNRNCLVQALDEDVVSMIPTGLDIHDSIIVATAIFYRDVLQQPAALITKDTKITKSGLIQTLW